MRLIVALVAVVGWLVLASDAGAGGIADEPCPNAHGEHTNTCPPGTVGMPYSLRFVETEGAGCGRGAQTFHFDSGALPPGLVLAPDGLLTGTAIEAGTFRFYVEMREPQNDPDHCAGKRTQKEFTLVIRSQPRIASTSGVPPQSEVGIPFRMRLRARGGSGIFSWDIAAGRLPIGVRLDDDGSIEGTPRESGTYHLVARARDTESRSLRWPLRLDVAPRLRIRRHQLPTGKVGRPYSARLRNAGGVEPEVWTLVRGRLPAGIRLAPATGFLVGQPRKHGTYVVALEARDGLKATATRTLVIVVEARALRSHGRSLRAR